MNVEIKRWRFILVVVSSGASCVLVFFVALQLLAHRPGFLEVLSLAVAAGLSGGVSIGLLLSTRLNNAPKQR